MSCRSPSRVHLSLLGMIIRSLLGMIIRETPTGQITLAVLSQPWFVREVTVFPSETGEP